MALSREEAEAFLALPKWSGSMPEAWRQDKSHAGLHVLEFGVLDADGARIRGLSVRFGITLMKRTGLKAHQLTLFSSHGFSPERCYDIQTSGRHGLRPGDHDFPHEHVGHARALPDNPAWGNIAFPEMLERFCARCTLQLTEPIPDPLSFKLV